MKYSGLLCLVFLMSGCVVQSGNKEGKAFDANFTYCNMLWNEINHPARKASRPHNQEFERDIQDELFESAVAKGSNLDTYQEMCESKAGFKKRQRDKEFKYTKVKD